MAWRGAARVVSCSCSSLCAVLLLRQSYSMYRDVSLRRVAASAAGVLLNRVIYIPHCGSWLTSDALIYLLQAVMVAFSDPTDGAVLAACGHVYQLLATTRDDSTRHSAVNNLLSFAAMDCFIRGIRLFVFADQLNALNTQLQRGGAQHDYLAEFPFSVLRSSVIPYWAALGVTVVTAISSNNDVLNEVRAAGRVARSRQWKAHGTQQRSCM